MPNESLSPRSLLGLVSIAAGVVLAAFFWGVRVFWFQGGPLGLVLIGLGALDLWESRRRGNRGSSRGLLQKLRDELMGPSRTSDPRRGGVSAPPGVTGSSGAENTGLDGEDSPRRR